jgi:hypothetical protein
VARASTRVESRVRSYWTNQRHSMLTCYRKKRPPPKRRQKFQARPTMFTDGSRLDSGAAGYSVVWQNGQCWVGIKTHIGHNQEVMTRSMLPSPGLWKQLQGARQPRRGLRSSQMPRLPSNAWPRRNLAPARCMRYRLESTSRRFGEHDRTSPLRPDGAQPTGASQETRSLTLAAWNGSNTQTGMANGQCASPDPLRISSGRAWKRNGWKPRCGRIRESLGINTGTAGRGRCARNQTHSAPVKTSKRLIARFY